MVSKTANPDTVRELVLYAENTSALYNQFLSLILNIWRRHQAGTYDPALAPKLWRYWYDRAAQMYTREHAGRGTRPGSIFSPADRQAAAEETAAEEYAKLLRGEHTAWIMRHQAADAAERAAQRAERTTVAAQRLAVETAPARFLAAVFPDPEAADPRHGR